jgi:hypothetical protein
MRGPSEVIGGERGLTMQNSHAALSPPDLRVQLS